jgi:signal transduction histidine kinase
MTRRHTVLVVDDEADVVKSVKDLLRFDYTVLGATKAEDAVKLMAEHDVDVVMTDQRMPGVTGVELLKQIKGPHPESTRLLFTGYADIRAVIEAINQGNVYRYITKPWDPDELQSIIREACERHDMLVQRRSLMAELEAKNADLERANVDLHEANDLKAAFIRVASHELRTPVAILVGYSELAQRVMGASGASADWMARIHRASARLQHLIDQIIGMLDVGDFQARLDRRPTAIAPLIAEAVEDVAPFVELRGQSLTREWPAELGTIELDAVKVRNSLNQLLLNAIKFTPDGGRITVSAEQGADGSISIRVADNGSGMDEASLKHFGDAFFTGYDVSNHSSGTFERDRRGLGLGASVVKKVIELHGGKLHVQSQPGAGTSITMTLPAAAPAAS